MTASPSQCVTVERCARRWWFEKVAELRVPNSKPQHFGHALHKLNAAFMGGTDIPQDWHEHLTDAEVERCLELRDRGIEKGVLRFRPGLLIEHDFRMPVKEQEMHGIIDVLDLSGVVEDHKAVASSRWAKTEDDLLADIPMMIYGGYLLSREPTLGEVTLRHNQFMQDTGNVRAVEVKVSRANVKAFWAARVMPLLRTMDSARGVEQWENVSGHDRLSEACTAYGGCPFVAICHKGLPIDQFVGCAPEKNGAPF